MTRSRAGAPGGPGRVEANLPLKRVPPQPRPPSCLHSPLQRWILQAFPVPAQHLLTAALCVQLQQQTCPPPLTALMPPSDQPPPCGLWVCGHLCSTIVSVLAGPLEAPAARLCPGRTPQTDRFPQCSTTRPPQHSAAPHGPPQRGPGPCTVYHTPLLSTAAPHTATPPITPLCTPAPTPPTGPATDGPLRPHICSLTQGFIKGAQGAALETPPPPEGALSVPWTCRHDGAHRRVRGRSHKPLRSGAVTDSSVCKSAFQQ